MKLFVDDKLEIPYMYDDPDDWIIVETYDEAIAQLETGKVRVLSLDHDLGMMSLDGYQIALWIEQKVAREVFTPPETLLCHSANPAGKRNIELAFHSIRKLVKFRYKAG